MRHFDEQINCKERNIKSDKKVVKKLYPLAVQFKFKILNSWIFFVCFLQ
jgi:hypothetical protein